MAIMKNSIFGLISIIDSVFVAKGPWSDDEDLNDLIDDVQETIWFSEADIRRDVQRKREEKLPEKEIRKIRRKASLWHGKKVKLEYSSKDLLNRTAERVYIILHNTAFNNIKMVPIKNIGPNSKILPGKIDKLMIDGDSSFRAGKKYRYDSQIEIYYYDKKEVKAPADAIELEKQDYHKVFDKFRRAGFTNIKKIPQKRLLAGIRKKSDLVESVSVSGNVLFSKGDIFKYDEEVEIVYCARLFDNG